MSNFKLNNIRNYALLSLIVSFCLCGLAGIIILIIGTFGETEQKVLNTTMIFAGYSILGLCCSILAGKRKFPYVAYTGVGICIAGLIYSIIFIWTDLDSSSNVIYAKLSATFAILAFSFAHSSLILLVPAIRQYLKAVLASTISAMSIVWIMSLYFFWNDGKIPFENGLYFRIMGVFGILAALGTISAPILAKIVKPADTN